MWILSKQHGIKPWEFNGDYDEQGHPIIYKDDLDALVWCDEWQIKGEKKREWKARQKAQRMEELKRGR